MSQQYDRITTHNRQDVSNHLQIDSLLNSLRIRTDVLASIWHKDIGKHHHDAGRYEMLHRKFNSPNT